MSVICLLVPGKTFFVTKILLDELWFSFPSFFAILKLENLQFCIFLEFRKQMRNIYCLYITYFIFHNLPNLHT